MTKYQINDVELDTELMTVTRGGILVHLRHKPYSILAYIAEAKGRPVTKSELVRNVMNKAVDTNSVAVHIHAIRSVLGKDIIKTRHSFGYVIGGGRG